MSRISQNVKYLREQSGKTKTWISSKISKSVSVIANYETGKAVPPLPVIEQYADLFGVYIGDLVGKDLWTGEGGDDPGKEPTADDHTIREKKALHLVIDLKEETEERLRQEIALLQAEMEDFPEDHPAYGRIQEMLALLKS